MIRLFLTGVYIFSIIIFVHLISCESDTALLSGNQNFQAEESFYYSALRMQQTRLKLNAITGAIHILGSSQSDTIIVNATKRVKSSSVADAEEHLSHLDVNVQNLNDEIIISTEQPLDTENRGYEIDYAVQLPGSLALHVAAITGSVTITAMNDTVLINHVTGNVFLDEVRGNNYVELVTGGIECDAILASNGNIDLKTVTGYIDLNIPRNTSANFSATVTTGSITLINITLNNRIDSGQSVTGILGTGDGNIALQTTTGNIGVTGL